MSFVTGRPVPLSKAHGRVSSRSRISITARAIQFRPCIDIHKGKVKQIVGGSLSDGDESKLQTNFESDRSSAEFAQMYRDDQLTGGHVIMLGADDWSRKAALAALQQYPGGMQLGGGVNPDNAGAYLDAGASHVIVTSYVFVDGELDLQRVKDLVQAAGGRQRVVLDLSCRRKGDDYYVVTDRWQRFSSLKVNQSTMEMLAEYCDEFLVHGVDVEGMKLGIDAELVALLGEVAPLPVTYAGGARTLDDLNLVKEAGKGRVDITVGSALDCFGGSLPYRDVVAWHEGQKAGSSSA